MIGISGISSSLLMQRNARTNSVRFNESLMRLATGRRINRAADDPAGMIASEQLGATLAALEAESKSLQRNDSIASTADGALSGVSDMLIDAKRLAAANANESGLSDAEKQANQMQIDSIMSSVDRISSSTSFNGARLLDGSTTLGAQNKQLNMESIATTNIGKVTIDGLPATLADVRSGGKINSISAPESAMKSIDAAISQVSTMRGKIGAFQKNTIRSRLNSIDTAHANILSAQSQIRDLDYALEASRKARFELLRQTSLILNRPRKSPFGHLLDVRA